MPQGGKTRPPHDREVVMRAYEMFEDGMTRFAIAKILGVHRDSVSRWLNNPGEYDPYLDEIAIERARQGEVAVYDRLTCWEREVVHEWLYAEHEKNAPLWRGNQHAPDPVEVTFEMFGSSAHRIYTAVIRWHRTGTQRVRRAA